MNRLRQNAPAWLTLPVLGLLVVGVLWFIAQAKSYFSGPDLVLTTIYRPKPVPVEVERVKWLTKTKIKTERVEIPVEVIREVSPKIEKRLSDGFHITLDQLHAEKKELVDVLDVPKAPRGGEMALTVDTDTGKITGTFLPKKTPLIEFGGIREAGVDYNVLRQGATGYYRQDLVRLGPAIVNGKAFATVPLTPGVAADYGVTIGVAVRF